MATRGRPRKYATGAEKQAAFRERWAIKEFRFEKETAETIERLAIELDVSESEMLNSLVKFALTNRNWLVLGVWGKRLPTVADLEREARRGAGKGGEDA